MKAEKVDQINQINELFIRAVPSEKAEFRVRNVSDGEVKTAMFDIGDDKSQGPDGFSSAFF